MKKALLILLLGTLYHVQAAQNNFGLYWIGNSLMMGGWACYEGWEFVGKIMITPDSATLGMTVRSGALKRGATDIPSQWQQDVAAGSGSCTGIGELTAPTGCITYEYADPWIATQSHYDYLVLQGYRWDSTTVKTELDYCSRYYDLGLSNGTKPIIFACWESPTTADVAISTYDSLYRKYRSRGALYLPVIQAHRLVWNDPTKDAATWLYDNDPYHHVNRRGAWLMDCVFYEVFTGRSSVGITVDDLKKSCNDARLDSMSSADIAYCEAKAHQAVIDYYGAGNVPHLGLQAVNTIRPASKGIVSATLFSKQGTPLSLDLAGREIGRTRRQISGTRVVIAKDASGRTGITVIGGR